MLSANASLLMDSLLDALTEFFAGLAVGQTYKRSISLVDQKKWNARTNFL